MALLDDFEESGIGWLWAADAQGRLIYMSDSAGTVLGQSVDTLIGQPINAIFATDSENANERSDRSLRFQLSARNRLIDLPVRCTLHRPEDGARRLWWSISGKPKIAADGEFLGYRGSAKDITTEYERKIEESRLAAFDSLTGVANRHRMNQRIDSYLAGFRQSDRSCTLMMLDLDRFKQVNDTMGHPAGDQLLCTVAQRLQDVVGARGEVGRLGGDEFQIILPDMADRGELGQLANRIIQIVSQPYPIDGKRAVIGTSLGIAVSPFDGDERDLLVRNADLSLYAAKKNGRGQYRFYSSDMTDEEAERRTLLDDLRDGMSNGQLELHYQPVVRHEDNYVVGLEALMRWQHPERGQVSPDVFIPLAEESNLINQLGEWALRRACADAMHWPSSISVAVNVSAVQFINHGFPQIVTNALAASGLDPARLELELTESVFVGDSETVDATFKVLKGLGVRLALDDFGTGYSSLSYLKSSPFDKLKVDRSFVESCAEEGVNSAKIITAILGLSEALGLETTVEGVEAFDQFDVVCRKGAKYIQGWIYSKALRFDAVMKLVEDDAIIMLPVGPQRHQPERRSVLREVGVVIGDLRHRFVMRDLSTTGAVIEGQVDAALDDRMVIDLGGGQLVVCTVRSVRKTKLAVEFETPLVNDGAGGLCTRHRISPMQLAMAEKAIEKRAQAA